MLPISIVNILTKISVCSSFFFNNESYFVIKPSWVSIIIHNYFHEECKAPYVKKKRSSRKRLGRIDQTKERALNELRSYLIFSRFQVLYK